MKNLRNRINKFYRMYDLTTREVRKMTIDDMTDRDALMTAYEAIWLTMDEYLMDDLPWNEYEWMKDLYGDLGDYIEYGYDRETAKAVTRGKQACVIAGFLGAFIFASCLPDGAHFVTIGGLLVSVALIIVAGVSLHQDR